MTAGQDVAYGSNTINQKQPPPRVPGRNPPPTSSGFVVQLPPAAQPPLQRPGGEPHESVETKLEVVHAVASTEPSVPMGDGYAVASGGAAVPFDDDDGEEMRPKARTGSKLGRVLYWEIAGGSHEGATGRGSADGM